MTIDEIIKLAREAASGMLSYDAEGSYGPQTIHIGFIPFPQVA